MRIMADIALVFHFSISEMEELDISELLHWHTLAEERARAIHGGLCK